MEVQYNSTNQQRDEQFLSLMILGIVSALKEDLITWDDAWNWLINARMLNQLESSSFDQRIFDAINHGTELDTIKRYIPHAFDRACDEILAQVKSKLKELSFPLDEMDYLLEIEISERKKNAAP